MASKEYNRQYRERNLERLRAYDRARVRPPEQVKKHNVYRKRWREENKSHVVKVSQNWYQRMKSDPERYTVWLQRSRDWAKNNREARAAIENRYKEKHPDKYAAKNKAHARKYKAQKKGAAGHFNAPQWTARKKFYGDSCAYCGECLRPKNTHIDHVIPVVSGGANWPSNLVPACSTCNIRKGAKRWLPRQPRPHGPLPD